ncbi:LacI family DNA-binding transcriptional regulator [Ktedonospora formicarum]|uniref:LacI family transcriptional regulator n=1 Tax=Ktedonospora formicarum TaxID=2778364 RepID=A0A8J3MPC4_9CHLR|nr:LacI family DNA-binding transcriptional regulator [Ktedonospora formicarum]GHO42775.1 LacI family transcriptional regulator [Ktedonospora formicarum]
MATIYDIARMAGVTPTTVSKVLAGKGSISAATRERVMQYARELNYQPNLIARSLIKGRTDVIGLVLHEMSNLFYAEIAEIAERLAYERNLRIFVTTIGKSEGQQLLQDLALRRVDGLIIAAGTISPETFNSMSDLHIPAVYCFWEASEQQVDHYVAFDFQQAGRLAAEHLLELGHRRFGVVSHVQHSRFTGFKETLLQNGISLDDAYIQWGESNLESGRVSGHKLLTMPERPTAIFATNDMSAMGVLSAAWDLGLRVPQDISIVGHDDNEITAYTTPPLTTIRIDKPAMLATSIDVLLSAIDGKPVMTTPSFPARLMTRQSSGPCPEE